MQKIKGLHRLLFLLCLSLTATEATQSSVQASKDTIIIMNRKGGYIPFTFFKKPVFEMTNDKLNIAVMDRNGDLIQINGIPAASLKNTVITPATFRTIYITNKTNDTYTDADITQNCILDIKCDNNKPGSPITVGLKTTVKKNSKTFRIYATLSGTIPTPTYKSIQSN
jgi:hypothetical protein